MSPLTASSIAFLCVFGASVVGLWFSDYLPPHYQNSESQGVMKLAMGLVVTMAALVLGLLISSAKGYFDTQSSEVTDMSARVVVLDRVLAHYGPETQDARSTLRAMVVDSLDRIWPSERDHAPLREPQISGEDVFDAIGKLSPKNETQSALKSQALNLALELGGTRWLMFTQRDTTVSKPILIIVIFWLTAIFLSFSLYAARNLLVITSLGVAALSVSGAVFLILEMYQPFGGLIHVSSGPLRFALAHLGA
jgi:hypothetical protein